MTTDAQFSKYSDSQAEMELLDAIMQTETPYPWNPTQVGSETYFMNLEQDAVIAEWISSAEIAERAQALFAQVDQLWSATTLQQSLSQKFAARVPQELLNRFAKIAVTIGEQAAQLAATEHSLAEQLVQCVQGILPHWSEEDLLVLARPFAYAMRETPSDGIESSLASVRSADWTELSEVEQARFSLVIARYALSELATQNQS